MVAVLLVFAMAGLVMAQTLARIPALRDHVGASPGELGVALVGGGLGALLAMPHTARLADRFGTRRVTAVAVVLACLGWGSVAFAPTVWVLGGCLLLAGAPVGVWDVAMNIQGTVVERLRGRSLMPVFHAAFSGGAVIGAGLGAFAEWRGIGLEQIPVGALLALVVGLVAVRGFVPDDSADPADSASGGDPVTPARYAASEEPSRPSGGPRRGLTGVEVLIGVVCLGAALAEGAANDWLALLLVDVRGAPAAFGALAYLLFNLTMAVGRLAGGPAIDRFGRDRVVRAGGLLAACGILLVVLVPSLPVALVGGLLWGLGAATVFPAAISAAGEVPGRGTRAIAVVSTIAYGALLFGAPTIGLLAEVLGLDRALLVVVAFLALMVLLGGALRSRVPAAGQPEVVRSIQ